MPLPVRLSQRAQRSGGEPIANLLMAKALAHPELVSLAAGFVDHQTLPVAATQQALEALWNDPTRARAALQYGTTIGHPPLREAIVDRMRAADGEPAGPVQLSADQVVVTAGSNQLLFLVADVLLDPGDIVLCGAPSYYVFLGTLANVGAQAVGVEVDQYGVVPEAIEAELRRRHAAGELSRVKAIYVTTYFDNPTGISLSLDRRAALVEIARRWSREARIYVIEDAAYRELRYYGPDVPSLRAFDPDGETVIHAGTFSKSFSPGIRVGWGVLPKALLGPVLAEKGNIDFGSPNFNQALMARVLTSGLFDAHVERLCDAYRHKLDAVLAAADELLTPLGPVEWVRPAGGLYLWLRLPETVDTGVSGPLFARAIDEGVLYVPGDCCYGDDAPRHLLRLSFSSPTPADIRRGVAALARALRQVLA
jgi:2-aminoadipate transaminase